MAVTELAALTARLLQLHEPAPALLHVHVRHAFPPVQSRGEPPAHVPAPLHVMPTVQNGPVQAVPAPVGVYVHAPAVHAAPVLHAGVAVTQSAHAPPPAPQAVVAVPAVHALLALQHPAHGPSAHDPPAMHRPVPVLHTAPDGQSAEPVHPHPALTHAVPFGLPAQLPHDAPPVPHVVPFCEPGGTQLAPLQQPPAHDAALHAHAPLTHAWPDAHVAHDPPPPPHAAALPPVWHWPVASQQPVGHVAGPHSTQVPVDVLHSSPPAQSPFDAHPQRPPARH